MASTFANVSNSSSTNYLFFFAQRTLALQNEPPTPPPLNVLGLPCNAMCRLWARLYQKQKQANLDMAKESAAQAEVEEKDLKGAEARITSDKAQCKTGSWNFSTGSWSFFTVQPLAKKITEYILDHQDDAAQEDRWRTTMKRETMKCFREQREESGNQRAAIDRQCEEVQTVKAEVQKLEAGVQKVETEMQSMQLKFDEAHSKMDEKMDQLVKNIAGLLVVVST